MKRPNTKQSITRSYTKPSGSLTRLALATLGIMSSLSAGAMTKNIGDLEIYQAASGGKGSATIAMMLDTSGSMRLIDAPYQVDYSRGSCYTNGYYGRTKSITTHQVSNNILDATGKKVATVNYNITGCATNGKLYLENTKGGAKIAGGYADRLSNLKVGLISLLADGTRLNPNDKIGIGRFPNPGFAAMGNMMIPAQPLTLEHRKRLINYVKNLKAANLTPSANAYAEAGAYMLGTNTAKSSNRSFRELIFSTYFLDLTNPNYPRSALWAYRAITDLTQHNYNTSAPPGFHHNHDKIQSGTGTGWLLGAQSQPYYASDSNGRTLSYNCQGDKYCGAGPQIQKLITGDAQQDAITTYGPYGTTMKIAIGIKVKDGYYPADMNLMSRSGFLLSDRTTKTADSKKYASPISSKSSAQCGNDGYGIYFLTDGFPNNSSDHSITLMNNSLEGGSTTRVSKYGAGLSTHNTQSNHSSGWQYIGQYAKILRDTRNRSGKEIRTATVGFGSDFAGMSMVDIEVTNPDGSTKIKRIPDCDSAKNQDVKNLCKWGEYPGKKTVTRGRTKQKMDTGGWGNGGFVSTGNADALAQSVVDFISDLAVDNTVPALPAGSIAIPDDPYSIVSQQATAYLPMLQPDLVSNKSAWEGNLKKYNIEGGTFYGKNKIRLYSGQNNASKGQIQGITLNPASVDYWSKTSGTSNNDKVTSGGVYSNLKVPKNKSERTVFIEDTANNKPTLRKFGVDTNGKLLLDGKPITASNTFGDTSVYTVQNVNHLLSFMGYNGMKETEKFDKAVVSPSGSAPKLGGILHSMPSLVSYSATIDDSGAVKGEGRDEYVLFGSMNGALHLVDADNQGQNTGGQEILAIIPKVMIQSQPKALSMSGHLEVGKPVFGVDAPWLVVANHVYDFASKKISIGDQPKIQLAGNTTPEVAQNRLGGMHAFGGFRMGAKGLYGIDLTDKNTPKIDFVITNSTSGFERIGYIWNKPTPARIKMNASDKYGTDVLIFGGGYDMCYEDEAFQVGENTGGAVTGASNCTSKSEADGNAVYIINAKTGALIWSASLSSSNGNGTAGQNKYTKVDNMKNSIVGGIEVLDRNNDGFMDHLYFADLGGQVFRADFVNAKDSNSEFKNHRVIRVLNEDGDGKYKRRFYEKPVVDFHADGKNGTFGLVMVISGDRSSPLSTMRSSNEHADRLYGIFDYDLTKPSSQLYPKNNQNVTLYAQDISAKQHLVELGSTNITKDEVRSKIVNDGKKGWYHPLQYFEGYKNALYTKGMGGSEIVRGKLPNHVEKSYLYTTVYNPDMRYAESNTCSAQVRGGSERQFYCLPYGVCDNSLLAGYQRAGMGIQQLAFAPSGSTDKRTRVLISSMLATEHTVNSYGKNLGGKGLFEKTLNSSGQISQNQLTKEKLDPGPGYGMQNSFSLTPQRWYDLSATN